MPIYSYIPQSAALQQLANRLYDPTMQFWSSAELARYLNEALRTWNALTAFWRGDFTFPSAQGQTWFDLTTVANTLRPFTVTDDSLYRDIQYALLEPAVGVNPWTGVSTQFTADDLLQAVARRRDEVLSASGCTVTRRVVPAVPGRITLPDSVIDVRRLAYLPNGGGCYGLGRYGVGPYGTGDTQGNSVVWPDDTFAEQAFDRLYPIQPAGTPSTYLLSTQPPISFDTDRAPALGGAYELLTVEAGATLSPATPTILPLPDDWTHVVKWGALADLLSRESNAKDVPRAAYCNQRYQMGLRLLSAAPALLAMRIGDVPLQIDSVRGADTYRTGWQAEAQDAPDTILQSGLNIIAAAPQPDAVPYTFQATVVQNAPLPVLPGDPVQVARDDLDVVLDYAQHLAALKQGGSEFQSTLPLFQRFLQQATRYNGKLAELGEYTRWLLGTSQREQSLNPVSVAPTSEESDGQ